MKRTRRLGYLAATAMLVLAGIAVPSAANAATGPGGRVITCKVQLDIPHGSVHVGGTISAASRVKCDGTVNTIYNKVILTNIPKRTAASESNQLTNATKLQVVAAKACSEGPSTFKSQQEVLVKFPAGFTPAQLTANKSATKSVACGNALAAVPQDETSSSVMSTDALTSDSGFDTITYTLSATSN